jgi:hypothetical protein
VVNQKYYLSPQRADYTGLHAQSLEGTCGPLREGWEGTCKRWGGEVFRPLSLSLRGWWRWAHLVLEVWVGLRGAEEFHDFGVTSDRGVDERRVPKLKERTERERGGTKGEGSQQEHTHTHDEGERGESERDRGTIGGGEIYREGSRSTCGV